MTTHDYRPQETPVDATSESAPQTPKSQATDRLDKTLALAAWVDHLGRRRPASEVFVTDRPGARGASQPDRAAVLTPA